MVQKIFIVLFTILQTSYALKAQLQKNEIIIVGAMNNVMRKGQLYSNIEIDTISNKQHLYGMGPVEYLTGELLIMICCWVKKK